MLYARCSCSQKGLSLKPPSSQVDKKKFPAILDSFFFTEVDSQMVVSGELNNWREAGAGW